MSGVRMVASTLMIDFLKEKITVQYGVSIENETFQGIVAGGQSEIGDKEIVEAIVALAELINHRLNANVGLAVDLETKDLDLGDPKRPEFMDDDEEL